MLLDTHWVKLSEILGRPELGKHPEYATIPARVTRRTELDRMLADFCAERTRDEVIDQISAIGLSVEKVLTPAEMVLDPHILARETIQSVRQPSGAEIKMEGPPAKMSRTPVRIRRAAPQYGMDTDEVLEAAGIDKACRSKLRNQGII